MVIFHAKWVISNDILHVKKPFSIDFTKFFQVNLNWIFSNLQKNWLDIAPDTQCVIQFSVKSRTLLGRKEKKAPPKRKKSLQSKPLSLKFGMNLFDTNSTNFTRTLPIQELPHDSISTLRSLLEPTQTDLKPNQTQI